MEIFDEYVAPNTIIWKPPLPFLPFVNVLSGSMEIEEAIPRGPTKINTKDRGVIWTILWKGILQLFPVSRQTTEVLNLIISDLSAVDTAVKAMEFHMETIKNRLREEAQAIPKAKKLIDMSLCQQKKLEHMFAHLPSKLPQSLMIPTSNLNSLTQDTSTNNLPIGGLKLEEDHPAAVQPKEKKGHGSAPLWYITAEELDSLSTYMKGRLTLDKVNVTINDMAAYAETTAQLISAPKKKLAENTWEKALELRDIAMKSCKRKILLRGVRH
ncbi:hypothetical protein MKX01_030625 [Papaver californicum]|nr:hypothetical protein MKX01_030625 [Papaver californicum]